MNAEKQYIDLFAQCEDLVCRNSAPALNALRAAALASFERLGFPSTKSEDYKYTDVSQVFAPDYGLNLKRVAIPVNPYDVFRCDVPNLSTSLYFVVNDTFYDKALPKAHLPEGVYAGGLRAFAEQHPEIVPDLKRLMDYYLPMTVKLLTAYAEMDAQPVQGETIQASKREIEDTLDTLNLAFEKLLDSVFKETAMDVSSDISVLNTLLAREGLAEDELTKLQKQNI